MEDGDSSKSLWATATGSTRPALLEWPCWVLRVLPPVASPPPTALTTTATILAVCGTRGTARVLSVNSSFFLLSLVRRDVLEEGEGEGDSEDVE